MKYFCAKKRVWGLLCASGAGFAPFPCQLAKYSDMSAEVHVQAQISPFFCSQVVLRFNLSRGAKKRRATYLLQRT
jgi:hypothetical protein